MTTDASAPDPRALAADIVTRSGRLLREMEALRSQLIAARQAPNEHIRGLKVMMGALSKDRQAAQSFLDSGEAMAVAATAAVTRFRSSNVPSMEQHWEIVKRCRHLVALDERLAKKGRLEGNCSGGMVKTGVLRDGGVVYVHAVVEGGAEWIRIVGTSEKKMLIEMAEAGWDWDLDDDDDDEEIDAQLWEHLDLLRSAKELVDAARINWHQYRHPRLRIIFTRIHKSQNKHLERLLQKLQRLGGDDIQVSVHDADSEWVGALPPIDATTAIANMLPQDEELTSTVILDSSVLVALASDICHSPVEKKPWHDADLQHQIDDERKGLHFFPSTARRLRGKTLVCTAQAQDQFHKIVSVMASTTEAARARLLFACDGKADFQQLSTWPVPADLRLPVRVLPRADTDLHAADLPSHIPHTVAAEVEAQLLQSSSVPGNRATHFYGWAVGWTVVTNNRALARRITRLVEASLTREYAEGPRICALAYNRALATRGPGPKKAIQLSLKGLWPPEKEEPVGVVAAEDD